MIENFTVYCLLNVFLWCIRPVLAYSTRTLLCWIKLICFHSSTPKSEWVWFVSFLFWISSNFFFKFASLFFLFCLAKASVGLILHVFNSRVLYICKIIFQMLILYFPNLAVSLRKRLLKFGLSTWYTYNAKRVPTVL